jgi:hypothetical protein
MNGPGIQIGKALRTFTKQAWPAIMAAVPDMREKETDWALWWVKSYPQTLKFVNDVPGDNQIGLESTQTTWNLQ